MADDVVITVRVSDATGPGITAVRRSVTRLGDDAKKSSGGFDDLKASMLSLAPAAVPVAAALAPIAGHAAGAGLAVAAFGAAVVPQIANLKAASDAQTKYSDAVTKYGANSKQAVAAQQQAAQVLAGMPRATQQAAAGYSILKDQFKSFSDSTAKFTMVPVEHSFAVLGQIIPKLKPMVEGTSTQFDRLMKVAGGAVNTAGFDALSKRVSDFANNSLKSATDRAIHFTRVLSEGNAHGPITSFMEYARAQGPAVKELFTNLAKAVANLLEGAAQAGPGMLTLVNAFAKLVAAVPPSLIGHLMQVYAAFKLIKLAGAGIGTAADGIRTLATRIATLSAASTAAGGGLAGLRAAFATLGTAAKATVVVAGIAAVVAVIAKLSERGRQAPPDVDKLTTSLRQLGSTGKATGEAARAFGTDLSGLYDKVRSLTDPSTTDKVQQFLVGWTGWDSTPVKDAKENIDSIDKALANLVKNGQADLAAAALKRLTTEYGKGGRDTKEITKRLDDYKSALADAKFEQQLAADSMGLFGAQAQAVQAKLDAQKASADGLRQSIMALNEAHRSAYDAETKFEAAIDNATKSIKDNGRTLDVHTEKGRANRDALSQLAAATEESAAKARENNASWSTIAGIYDKGRKSIYDNALAITHNRKEAQKLTNTLLNMPKSMSLKMRTEDAVSGLNNVISALKKTPNSKSIKVKALSADAISMLKDLGFTVKKLPDGRVKVTSDTKNARLNIAAVKSALAGLKGKSITLSARDRASATARAIQAAIDRVRGKTVTITTVQHTLGVQGTAGRNARNYNNANGSVMQFYADGGTREQHVAQIAPAGSMRVWGEPETGGEAYIPLAGAKRDRSMAILEDVADRFGYSLEKFAHGGLSKKQKAARARAKAQTDAENQARHDAMGDLTISHFGHMAGYKRSEFGSALAKPDSLSSLVDSLNHWASVIKASTRGGQEKTLLKALDSAGKKLLGWEKQLGKVTASLEKAKDKLNNLKDAAAQLSASVKGGVLSSANITRGANGEAPVTTKSVMAGLTQSRDKAASFASALKQLQKKGLSKDLIQQIAEAGIEGGGLETAGALLGASSSEIKSMNKLQGQIGASASSAGKTTADAVYKDAIARQSKIVTALGKQQEKLTTAMNNLTKSLEGLVQKVLGKKAKAAGGIVGMAASGGIRGGLTWVGEHGPELADLPVGSRVWSNPDSQRKAQAPWASMLNEPRRGGGRAAGAGAGSMQPVIVHQTIELDGKVIARQIFDPLRAEIAHRGGSVQRSLGQGAG
jgi:ABC-type Fe2+-enterobactin transport system substrate-binding protein